GIRVGLLRPITLSPFPSEAVAELAAHAQAMLVGLPTVWSLRCLTKWNCARTPLV
ncbi:MAG: hypothetical protein IT297_02130, partial [Anaerolineae bacterium]|nr:hypothetical protein [Anaerolineae bacterium]